MTKTSKPLAFFGAADFSLPSLQALLEDERYHVEVVITRPDSRMGRGKRVTAPAVKTMADEHGVPVLQPASKQELTRALDDLQELDAGVVVAYGLILPQAVLDHFRNGLINVHASLLPRWRGPSPVEAAILHGDKRTGVSLMRLDAGMDTGPVYSRSTIDLDGTETKPELSERLSRLGASELCRHLEDILSGNLRPRAQSETGVTYSRLIKKSDGKIDWRQTAADIDRQIRAYLGWPGSNAELAERSVTITGAHVSPGQGTPGAIETDNGELKVYCGQDALVIDRLVPAGRQEMDGAEFIRGYLDKPQA